MRTSEPGGDISERHSARASAIHAERKTFLGPAFKRAMERASPGTNVLIPLPPTAFSGENAFEMETNPCGDHRVARLAAMLLMAVSLTRCAGKSTPEHAPPTTLPMAYVAK